MSGAGDARRARGSAGSVAAVTTPRRSAAPALPGRVSLSSWDLSPDNPGWHAGRIPIREAAWKVGE